MKKHNLQSIRAILVKILRIIGSILSILLVCGLIYAIYRFGNSLYTSFFVRQTVPFSIGLTKFNSITVETTEDCASRNKDSFPVQLVISRPSKYVYNPSVLLETNKAMDFQVVFPFGELSAEGYLVDNSSQQIALPHTSTISIIGSATQVEVEYPHQINSFAMHQYFCGPEIDVLPFPSISFSGLYTNKAKSVWIDQLFQPGDQIKVTIINPQITEKLNTNGMQRVEFEFSAADSSLPFEIGLTANDLKPTLPEILTDFGSYTPESLFILSNQIEIVHPVGSYKLGNDAPKELPEITSTSDDRLSIPSISGKESFQINELVSHSANKFDITGDTNSLILNNEELVKSAWYTLPEYIQAGLFGLLLTLISGIWALRSTIWRWLSFNFFDVSMPKGSFVCVTNSGMVIAGELFQKPRKNYPYYLIKNARRKLKSSDHWEKDMIAEIKVREDSIEQTYVL